MGITRVCVRDTGGNFPLELNSLGLEETNAGQAASTELVLGIGQVPRDSELLTASMCVIHAILAGECNVSFKFVFVSILLFSWKLHTGISISNRSSLGQHPGTTMKDME